MFNKPQLDRIEAKLDLLLARPKESPSLTAKGVTKPHGQRSHQASRQHYSHSQYCHGGNA
jgi:hypothetical protein